MPTRIRQVGSRSWSQLVWSGDSSPRLRNEEPSIVPGDASVSGTAVAFITQFGLADDKMGGGRGASILRIASGYRPSIMADARLDYHRVGGRAHGE
jgi:hypothetical protein